MVAGVGTDLVWRDAFAALLDEPGTVFGPCTFTAQELATARSRPSGDPVSHLAARYAAKEACVKALSAALAPGELPRAAVDLREIEVVCDAATRPSIRLHGRVAALARAARVNGIHLSMSHEGGLACAFVIAER